MNTRLFASAAIMFALLVSPALAGYGNMGAESGGDYTFLGGTPTAWDPGLNSARVNVGPAPGGASWSAMPVGIFISGFAPFETIGSGGDHPIGDLSVDIETMVTPAADGLEYGIFDSAFDVWAAAALITNLGKVSSVPTLVE